MSEALHDPHSGFHPERFKARYGALPAGFGRLGTPESSLLPRRPHADSQGARSVATTQASDSRPSATHASPCALAA